MISDELVFYNHKANPDPIFLWHEMEPDLYDDNGDGIPDVHYWGNIFYPDMPIVPQRGKWYCMELMIKANDAGQSNGEMAR
jgi:hypothetical protein